MKLHALPAGRLRMREQIFRPEAPREATIDLPVGAFLIRHPQGNAMFDTGCHPSVIADAEGRWGGLARLMAPIFTEAEALPASLAATGLGPDDIDLVICSHLHPDHCGCNGMFHRASLICHAAELDAARAPDAGTKGYVAADWDQGLAVRPIAGAHDVFGDGRLTLLPVPGHTPGCLAAHVVLDHDGAFVLAADAASLRDHLDRDFTPRNTWNHDRARDSLAELRRLRADGARVICGHDERDWAALRTGAAFYA
ncbi:MAG: N-acyl homoserine lactonase family protein [Rhodospirillales bacterium]|nr:N-acyl homoserine lactonase family protein [Rhodospirillales bacterium]